MCWLVVQRVASPRVTGPLCSLLLKRLRFCFSLSWRWFHSRTRGPSSLLRTLQNRWRLSPASEWRLFASYSVYEDVRMSPPPPEDGGRLSPAHCQQGQLNISTNVVLPFCPGSPFQPPPHPRGLVLFSFMPGFFGSAMLPASFVFDLAPFEAEAGAPATVSRVCVSALWGVRVSGGRLHFRAKLPSEDQSGSPPLPSSCRDRKKEGKQEDHFTGTRDTHTQTHTHTHTGGKFCLPCYHFIARVQGGLKNSNL